MAFPSASRTYRTIVFPQALAGEVGMSSELDEVARALFNGQIPSIWRKLAPATLKSLGNWMEHFLKRLNQYNKWVSQLRSCVVGALLFFLNRKISLGLMRFVCVSLGKLYFCDFPLKHQVQLQIFCVNPLSEIPGLPYPHSPIYSIHFEITGDPCNLIGLSSVVYLRITLFFALNHICSKSRHSCSKLHHFGSMSHHFCFEYKMRCKSLFVSVFQQTGHLINEILVLTEFCDFKWL